MNGINVIAESERKGHPRDLFWPWGLVTSTSASWLTWQGYLLGPFGLGGKGGPWAFANLGVLLALAAGFLVTLAFSRSAVRSEEAGPLGRPAAAEA